MFSSRREGVLDLYQIPVGGSGGETLLFESPDAKDANDWSPNGRFLLYAVPHPERGRDLWAVPIDGNRTPFLIAQTSFEETSGRFSPDGNWVAYQSNETGATEVWVRPFPGPGRNWQISTNGGAEPKWRRDGKEIFYRAGNRVMAAPISLDAENQSVLAGTPVELFTLGIQPLPPGGWDALPDGEMFLISSVVELAPPSPITVVLNWTARNQ